jgi:hypothetical protein
VISTVSNTNEIFGKLFEQGQIGIEPFGVVQSLKNLLNNF